MTDAGFNKPPHLINWDAVVFLLISLVVFWILFLWNPHTNPNRIGGRNAGRISTNF